MEECKTYPAINDLAGRIAKVEEYHAKKNPKKPQVAIGDIREILGILADVMHGDSKITTALLKYGIERHNHREKAKPAKMTPVIHKKTRPEAKKKTSK